MDAGLTIRPTANVAETMLVRPEPVPVRTAVATTLGPAKSVTATADARRPAGYDPARNQAAQPQPTTRDEVFIDPQTREVIFRVIDIRTNQVDRQIPDEALLRMRAYNRALVNGENPLDSEPNMDTEA